MKKNNKPEIIFSEVKQSAPVVSQKGAPAIIWSEFKEPETPKPQASSGLLDRFKQFGQGVLSGFTRGGLEEAASQLPYGMMEAAPGIASPIYAPSAIKGSQIARQGIEALESAKPQDGFGRVLHTAGEFGGGALTMPMPGQTGVASFLKGFGANSAIGANSGVLQQAGANPIAADLISAFAAPAALAGAKNTLNKFSPSHRKTVLEKRLHDYVRDEVTPEQIPESLKAIENYRTQEKPLDVGLNTAEIINSPGFSSAYQSLNTSSKLKLDTELRNEELLKTLKSMGTVGLDKSERGEAIRRPFAEQYQARLAERAEATKPLYEQLEQSKNFVQPTNALPYLDKAIDRAAPDTGSALEKYYRVFKEQAAPTLKELQKAKNAYANFLKTGELPGGIYIPPSSRAQVEEGLLQNIKALEEQATRASAIHPQQAENILQQLGSKQNEAYLRRDSNKGDALKKLKQNLEQDFLSIPEGLKHRELYAKLSQPVNEFEQNSLLNRFVTTEKDIQKPQGYVFESEKIPDLLFKGKLQDTKELIKRAESDPELMGLIKGAYIDKVLDSSDKMSGLSYGKMKNFLKNHKERIDIIFNEEEKKKLYFLEDVLKRYDAAQTKGRKKDASTTAPILQMSDKINQALSGVSKIGGDAAEALAMSSAGKLKIPLKIGKSWFNRYNQGQYNQLLEKVIAEPNYYEQLMKNPPKPKSFGDFYNKKATLPRLGATFNNNKSREQ